MDTDNNGTVEQNEFIMYFKRECKFPHSAPRVEGILDKYVTAICDFFIRIDARIRAKIRNVINFQRTHSKEVFLHKHLGPRASSVQTGGQKSNLNLPKKRTSGGPNQVRSISIDLKDGQAFSNPIVAELNK
jgi:hypothetical protein